VIYIAAGAIDLLSVSDRNSYFMFCMISIVAALFFGSSRLKKNPISFTNTAIRIVQPSIPQSDKWDEEVFWEHLNKHTSLSRLHTGFKPDIILWSEAAVTAPYRIKSVMHKLQSAITSADVVLVTGGVNDNESANFKHELRSAMYAITKQGKILFEYHKAHLVPFGEYMPLKSILPVKKLTPGIIDYTPGTQGVVVELPHLVLKIRPLICYEAIFPGEVREDKADVMINITNDSWYGNSSGPYQHFHAARMRAVENGIPMIRAANSGISAIIDPLGRVISETKLWAVTVLDGKIPHKLPRPTLYYLYGEWMLLFIICISGFAREFLRRAFSSDASR
jgi:apolipoprotein N-acyltransferase